MKFNNNKGFTLPVVPIILSLLLAFSAIGLDLGRAFILRHQLQAAADAAALAGSSMTRIRYGTLADGSPDFGNIYLEIVADQANTEAEYYFNENLKAYNLQGKGVTVLEQKGGVITDNVHYKYYVKAEMPLIFGPFIGLGQKQRVSVTAEALASE